MPTFSDTIDPDDSDNRSSQLVSPAIRAFRLLRYVAEGGSTSNLSEVGRIIGINRVTVMRLVTTLEYEGILEGLPQGGHRIGLDFLRLASTTVASNDLLGLGRRILAEVRCQLNLSTHLTALDGGHVVYLLRDLPEAGLISSVKVGSRVAAHLTTAGRILLAHHPSSMLRGILGDELPGCVSEQGADKYERLEETLARDRERGCAWSFSGYEQGINSCAAPVFDALGNPIAAICAAGPETAFKATPGLQARAEQVVKDAARDLSQLLGYRLRPPN